MKVLRFGGGGGVYHHSKFSRVLEDNDGACIMPFFPVGWSVFTISPSSLETMSYLLHDTVIHETDYLASYCTDLFTFSLLV
jgi:hypothetical protein